jgi:hypothetical protein
MADEIRVNRAPSVGRQDGGMPPSDMREYRSAGRSKLPWVILAVVVIVLVVLGVLFRDKLFNKGGDAATDSGRSSGYQAVFLTNGQVYFGKLSGPAGQYATLEDIYYLQVTQPPLQGSQSQAAAQQQPQAQPQLSLVKLGQELHGPVDSMQINRDQILFFEDIKENGKVMEAIRQYQKNPPANNQTGTPAPTAPVAPANGTQNQGN